MVTTKMNWSGPNVTHFGRKSQFGPDQFILVYLDQIIMVKSKSIWSDQNCFGHIEGQGINVVQYSIISDEHISLYDIYVCSIFVETM